MDVFGRSDVGLARKINEDSLYYGWNANHDFIGVVCDGIGGAAAGEVASGIAVSMISEQFMDAPVFHKDYEVDEWIRLSLSKINDMIYTRSMWSRKNRGMGTTIAGVLIASIGTYIFHAGDSRIYAMYPDGLIQMSEDHSVIQSLLSQKKITPQQALTHEKRNTLTNALGVWRLFRVEVNKIKPDYSMLMVCSDGLHSYVDIPRILSVLKGAGSLEEKTAMLINLANAAGGHDNCSVLLVDKEPPHA